MGVITYFPINTATVPELPPLIATDLDAAEKHLIEITENTGTSIAPVYGSGASKNVPLDQFKSLCGLNRKRFFEKCDRHVLVYSSLTDEDEYDGTYMPFEITPDMQGYYLAMHLLSADGKTNDALLWGNNLAFDFKFAGTFPDGFAIRIQPLTLGASKTNVSQFYLTSGKTYDFVYNLELDHWAIDEMQNVCHPSMTYLPNYKGVGDFIYLTNSNHTYVYKYGTWSSPAKKCILPATNLWRARKIEILIDRDIPNDPAFGPFFYPQFYAEATGLNDYVADFDPVFLKTLNGQIIWVVFPATSTGLVTIDIGRGVQKVYIDGIQANSGDIIHDTPNIIYQFSYEVVIDGGTGLENIADSKWNFDKFIDQPDTIDGDSIWRFPYGVSGIKKGSSVVFESDGFGSISVVDMNIII